MSEQYTISAVSPQTTDDGDYRIYYVKLQEAQPKEGVQAFELVQKKATNAPKAGQTIIVKTFKEGTRDGKPTVQIVKDWDAIKAKRASGGGSSGGGGDDARGESIERQVAAKVAGEMAVAVAAASDNPSVIHAVANFEGFFDAVLAKIKGGPAQQQLNEGGGEVPADTAGLVSSPAAATDDSTLPF